MKLTYIFTALFAALVSAQPVSENEEFPEDYTSGNITGEAVPQLASVPLTKRALVKRQNVQFRMYDSSGKSHLIACLTMSLEP